MTLGDSPGLHAKLFVLYSVLKPTKLSLLNKTTKFVL